jgi:hypothetical protein
MIKATKEGKLYIDSKDFFNDKKVKRTIKKLLKYKIVDGKLVRK